MAEFNFMEQIIEEVKLINFLNLLDNKPKLNLGCHLDIREDFVNVDVLDLEGVDLQADVSNLSFIPDGRVKEIIAYDLLEHFPFDETQKVLAGWIRLLKPGGKLIVQTPDLERLAKALLDGDLPVFEVQRLLYGGQEYASNFHMAGFTGHLLEGYIIGAGCSRIVQVVRPEDSFNVVIIATK